MPMPCQGAGSRIVSLAGFCCRRQRLPFPSLECLYALACLNQSWFMLIFTAWSAVPPWTLNGSSVKVIHYLAILWPNPYCEGISKTRKGIRIVGNQKIKKKKCLLLPSIGFPTFTHTLLTVHIPEKDKCSHLIMHRTGSIAHAQI